MGHASPPLHADLAPLAELLGTWEGEGTGVYPTIEPFAYTEQLAIGHGGKPFLTWLQRTWSTDDQRPLHTETGYLRCRAEGSDIVVEFVVAHPTGHVEVAEGRLERSELEVEQTSGSAEITAEDGDVTISTRTVERLTTLSFDLRSTSVAMTASAKQVDSLERRVRLDGDDLGYTVLMGAVGQSHQAHLRAELNRTP